MVVRLKVGRRAGKADLRFMAMPPVVTVDEMVAPMAPRRSRAKVTPPVVAAALSVTSWRRRASC